jgi:hypothetical protein
MEDVPDEQYGTKLERYLAEHPVPVVRGPGNQLYMTGKTYVSSALPEQACGPSRPPAREAAAGAGRRRSRPPPEQAAAGAGRRRSILAKGIAAGP